jgi:hypothetical protein
MISNRRNPVTAETGQAAAGRALEIRPSEGGRREPPRSAADPANSRKRTAELSNRVNVGLLGFWRDVRTVISSITDSAGSGKIPFEAGENLMESLEAASEQSMWVPMWVPILGSARPRSGGCRQAVALEDLDRSKYFPRALAIDSPPIPAPITTAR